MTTCAAQQPTADLFVMCIRDHKGDQLNGGSVFLCEHPHRPVYIWSRHRAPLQLTEADIAQLGGRMGPGLDSIFIKPIETIRVSVLGKKAAPESAALKRLGIHYQVQEITCEFDIPMEELLISLDHEKRRTSWMGEVLHRAPQGPAATAAAATLQPRPEDCRPIAWQRSAVFDTPPQLADPVETTPAPSSPSPAECLKPEPQ